MLLQANLNAGACEPCGVDSEMTALSIEFCNVRGIVSMAFGPLLTFLLVDRLFTASGQYVQ